MSPWCTAAGGELPGNLSIDIIQGCSILCLYLTFQIRVEPSLHLVHRQQHL